MTGDAYRERVRAMDALEHFGSDYRPLDAAARECLCDAEPGVFAVFSFAVLAMHQTRRPVHSGTEVCSCGQSVVTCPVQSLARGLLFAPRPEPPADTDTDTTTAGGVR